MAGIYIHIPFCRQACHYCNFHFSTSQKSRSDIVKAIVKELELRQNYLPTKTLETIYFGGGTPSVLKSDEISDILTAIGKYFNIESSAEITLEANPEDLTTNYLEQLREVGINRLSIGVQSFIDNDLQFMNRSHNATQAKKSIEAAQNIFEDISIDLIFGGQYSSPVNWTYNLKTAILLDPVHISSYSLTIEDGTTFGNWMAKNKLQPIKDETQKEQFLETIESLSQAGYEHYEISNYAKPGQYARHNTNYWRSKPYLGIGPSAHSFDGHTRQWNVSNNHQYLKSILNGEPFYTIENLTEQDQYNEYILTSLRTMWGCDRNRINSFDPVYQDHFDHNIRQIISDKKALSKHNILYLTQQGKLFADQVAEELFYIN